MFDRFTDRARKVMSFSKLAAEQCGHDHIGPEHLLLGLLRESGGLASQVFTELGATAARLETAVRDCIKPGECREVHAQLPFSPAAKTILERATQEATGLDHNYVGTEHLLLAMAAADEGLPAKVLAAAGVTSPAVRKAVLKLLAPKHDAVSIAIPLPAFQIAPYLEELLKGQNLSRDAATQLAQAIAVGRVQPASLGALIVALRSKGESVDEIAAFAEVMRSGAVSVKAPPGTLDTCGTGGDKSGTFNISTCTALVVAGMGIPVAKHGGRSVSSSTGSADVLKALGVNVEVQPTVVERCIAEAHIGFMFAPAHHPGMRHVAPVRKELGVRSIFNLLGPLANPAGARLQLIGVCDEALAEKFARVLKMLGSESVLVVCGTGPGGKGCLDEVSTFGPTTLARLKNGSITMEKFDPAHLGISTPSPEALRASSVEHSASIIRSVLKGTPGPARDVVLLNAAAAALVAGRAARWEEGVALAAKAIDERHAAAALEKLVSLTHAAH